METYDMLGLGPQALAGGIPARGFNLWVQGRPVGQLQFSDMAKDVPSVLEAGVGIIGSCCGSTPDHTKAIRQVVDSFNRGM